MRRGTRVSQAYIAITADGSGINEDIINSVDEAGDGIDKKGEEHGDRYGENFSDGFFDRLRSRFSRGFSRNLDNEIGSAGDDAGDTFASRMSDRMEGLGDRIRGELSDRLASNPEQVRRGIDRAFDDEFADRLGDRFASRMLKGFDERFADFDFDAMLNRSVSGNGGSSSKDSPINERIGRLFGMGSRNNFFNTLGSSMNLAVSGASKLTSGLSSLATKAFDAFKGVESLSDVTKILRGGFMGAAGGVGSLMAALPALLPALGAVVLVLSAMASVIGAIVGLLVAMASTIASALVAALAVALPLMGAFAVSGGLIVAAFTSMTNAQKDYLFSAFQPFKAALTGLGQIIMTEFTRPLYNGQSAIQVWSTNLQNALLPLSGVARSTAGAFAQAGNIITASLSGPGFQRFFSSLSRELPTIVINLSRAFGGFFNGLAGMFSAILPYVTTFSRYLANVAREFSEWANSPRGQNAIVDFVGRAVESLKSLWGFVKQFGGLISDIFFSPVSQRAGNSIFDSMARAFEKMRKAFQKAARSGDLERWFNDAIEFGGNLWKVISALYGIFVMLYNSGVLEGIGTGLSAMATVMNAVKWASDLLSDSIGFSLPQSLSYVLGPLGTVVSAVKGLGDMVNWVLGLVGVGGGSAPAPTTGGAVAATPTSPGGLIGPWAPGTEGNPMPYMGDLNDLITSGNTALNNTYQSMGGYLPDPVSPSSGGGGGKPKKPKPKPQFDMAEWTNPYKDYAESLISEGRRIAEEIRTSAREAREEMTRAIEEVNKSLSTLINDAGTSFSSVVKDASATTDAESIFASFQQMIDQFAASAADAMANAQAAGQQMIDAAMATRQQMIDSAQGAVNSAAQDLASASSEKEVKRAQRRLAKARRDLDLAYAKGNDLVRQAQNNAQALIDNAKAAQDRIYAASLILSQQTVVDPNRVLALTQGLAVQNATLAEYAMARDEVARQLEAANQRLDAALALRDNYQTATADAVRAYGSLMTAQARVVDGVQQALTATDITDNLRSRLEKVKKFQENLRLLLAQGLSESAYKQLVDAGVETGGAYAQAIVDGGQGAVSEVNNLTDQIDAVGEQLGDEASSFLYQAGVDAAQGLVDGLTSLSQELTTAATQLGEAIAQAIRNALGIASPSRVLRYMMTHVGDGAVLGLDDQHVKVSAAAARLSDQIAVSPEVASYEAQVRSGSQGADVVSGNGEDRPLVDVGGVHIHTPTQDPRAVANEAINELVERIT